MEECNICYEKKEIFIILPCKHELCDLCFKSWVIRNHSCPFCRKEITGLRDMLKDIYNNSELNQINNTSRLSIENTVENDVENDIEIDIEADIEDITPQRQIVVYDPSVNRNINIGRDNHVINRVNRLENRANNIEFRNTECYDIYEIVGVGFCSTLAMILMIFLIILIFA